MADRFRELEFPVLYIQHDGTGSGEFEKHTAEWEILDGLRVESTDLLIDKYANDVFYKSKLLATLEQLQTDELYISGCATDFCVESTVQSALSKDFNITIIADGHTTGERPELTAKQVIDHYNWVWQNMIPTQWRIVVKHSKAILDELSVQ